jgi:hypothetical protein
MHRKRVERQEKAIDEPIEAYACCGKAATQHGKMIPRPFNFLRFYQLYNVCLAEIG